MDFGIKVEEELKHTQPTCVGSEPMNQKAESHLTQYSPKTHILFTTFLQIFHPLFIYSLGPNASSSICSSINDKLI